MSDISDDEILVVCDALSENTNTVVGNMVKALAGNDAEISIEKFLEGIDLQGIGEIRLKQVLMHHRIVSLFFDLLINHVGLTYLRRIYSKTEILNLLKLFFYGPVLKTYRYDVTSEPDVAFEPSWENNCELTSMLKFMVPSSDSTVIDQADALKLFKRYELKLLQNIDRNCDYMEIADLVAGVGLHYSISFNMDNSASTYQDAFNMRYLYPLKLIFNKAFKNEPTKSFIYNANTVTRFNPETFKESFGCLNRKSVMTNLKIRRLGLDTTTTKFEMLLPIETNHVNIDLTAENVFSPDDILPINDIKLWSRSFSQLLLSSSHSSIIGDHDTTFFMKLPSPNTDFNLKVKEVPILIDFEKSIQSFESVVFSEVEYLKINNRESIFDGNGPVFTTPMLLVLLIFEEISGHSSHDHATSLLDCATLNNPMSSSFVESDIIAYDKIMRYTIERLKSEPSLTNKLQTPIINDHIINPSKILRQYERLYDNPKVTMVIKSKDLPLEFEVDACEEEMVVLSIYDIDDHFLSFIDYKRKNIDDLTFEQYYSELISSQFLIELKSLLKIQKYNEANPEIQMNSPGLKGYGSLISNGFNGFYLIQEYLPFINDKPCTKLHLEHGVKELEKLHKLGIIHGDVKIDNCCYNYEDNKFYLIDFNNAYFSNTGDMSSVLDQFMNSDLDRLYDSMSEVVREEI
ncbi:Serine/threonine-protein kinase [Wickerhamomyces ciferrii]|uniref:Serine/threonine-protein kinase n=1 Tax=Wickerhamomyces ciferrii (strain ATCC 14091 / BCRC 22168 / CBS 111 / JCM 3599 / NBRC 0793 / NRRL Y-1031 F-60-10) TaxID=1206466 RepID=K0KFM0_WICCF|nr:Serine/threonine-protein kinase [Wickerhamomyces ciferrii]CCH41032.1 Serine/threonine-protein kinase [Wickerhamomyces ciferrii]